MSDTTGNKQRLLIVDDSKVIRVTARKILRDHFETVEAVDGENAWEILNSAPPFSVIVSDLTMPNLDGFGLLERIRGSQQPHIRDLPVIVITGANDSEAVKQRASASGATDFIGKPFDSVHLLARTQAHASANAATRSLTEKMIELEDQSLVDPLTGLPNELAFMERGYQQLSYAIRHDTSLSIFRVGIDHYGTLYKTHGKETTDALIKTVASVLNSSIRDEDMVARTGAAHFSLLLPGMNKHGIRSLADRISRDLDGRILKHGEQRVHISVSIGIVAPEIRRDMHFDELLKLANKRLFQALKQGGHQVVFEDMDTAAGSAWGTGFAATPVKVISAEAIREMITQAVDAGSELEEIVLSAPPMSTGEETDQPYGPTVIENRGRKPGSKPASPPADRASVSGVPEAVADTMTNSTPPSGSTTPGPPTGRAVFSIHDPADDQDESAANTTSLDSAATREPQCGNPHSAASAASISAEASPADEPRIQETAAPVVRPPALHDAETEAQPERTGLFRRMLRGIGYLFGARANNL